MKVSLLSYTNNAEKVISTAARLCYSKDFPEDIFNSMTDENNKKYIDMLFDLHHTSPIEHANYTFAISGVSRSLLAQITRHRHASFSVQSQRYVDMTNLSVVIPDIIKQDNDTFDLFNQVLIEIQQSYESIRNKIIYKLIEEYLKTCEYKNYEIIKIINIKLHGNISFNITTFKKYLNELLENTDDIDYKNIIKSVKDNITKFEKNANENSRSVLPNAATTTMIVTMNARSLYNFFSLRCCNRAQQEIRELAYNMLNLVSEVSPNLFKYAGPPCLTGPCPEGKMSCKNNK